MRLSKSTMASNPMINVVPLLVVNLSAAWAFLSASVQA